MITVRSVLAATDLTDAGDAVVQTAAVLAEAFEAQLHVVHVAAPWTKPDAPPREGALKTQMRRSVSARPSGLDADAVQTAVVYDRPYHGILVHAAAVGADLIVMGRHGRGPVSARWGGTTAERVLRSADVPCLVVGDARSLPFRHVGVTLDFTLSSRAGADLMLDWLPRLGPGTEQTLSLVHVASRPAEAAALLEAEVERVTPGEAPGEAVGSVRVEGVLRTGRHVARAAARWAEEAGADLIVVSSEGRRGWRRVWRGSEAAMLTARADCPVLLIPPAFWRRAPISPARAAVAIDEETAGGRPRRWVEDWAAAATPPVAVRPIEPDANLLGQTRTHDADLLVVYEPRGEQDAPVRSDLTALLERTPVPVLVLRGRPAMPVRRILVAVDTGDIWYEKLGWARRLAERFGAHVTVYHAIDLSVGSRVRREPGGELVSASSVWLHDGVERKVVPAMREWLWERVRLVGLPLDQVDVKVGLQDPWFAIPAVAQKDESDLVIVAAHPRGTPGRARLSRVARATLGRGPYSTLVVVDRAKREAEWGPTRPQETRARTVVE
jgi:nucleotide-binding universal stress UspA family protein